MAGQAGVGLAAGSPDGGSPAGGGSADGGPDIDAQATRLAVGCAEILPVDGLRAKLAQAARENRPLRVKLGIDPSGSELTLGHAVVLRKLRQFQDFGHTAVLIVGDFTGRVGDPTGKSATRKVLTAEETVANSHEYFDQVMRILDPDRVEIRRNAEWLEKLPLQDFLTAATSLTVAQLLERDDFARRYRESRPISLMEFFYPLLQGYDSVAVDADIELGGTDQTYNNLVGRTLQRDAGLSPQVVITVPLLVGTDGVEKMGKSLGNWIGIREPAAEQFGKLMSIPDSAVATYAALCADFTAAEMAALTARMAAQPAEAKRDLAERIVALYHGAAGAAAAREQFNQLFQRREVPTDVPVVHVPAGEPVDIPGLLVSAGLAKTKSEVRRLVDQGGIKIDGVPLASGEHVVDFDRVIDRVVQRGRRQAVRVRAHADRPAPADR